MAVLRVYARRMYTSTMVQKKPGKIKLRQDFSIFYGTTFRFQNCVSYISIIYDGIPSQIGKKALKMGQESQKNFKVFEGLGYP